MIKILIISMLSKIFNTINLKVYLMAKGDEGKRQEKP